MAIVPCVGLAGVGSYMTVGDLPLAGLTSFTIEGWWRIHSLRCNQYDLPLFTKYVSTGDDVAVWLTKNGVLNFDMNTHQTALEERPIPSGWVHLAFVVRWAKFDPVMFLYVNGQVQYTSFASPGSISITGVAARFGGALSARHTANPIGLVGRMGWQRVSSVARDFLTTGCGSPDQPPATDASTIGLWYCNEGSGTTVDNQTGVAAYDGVLTNCVWVNSNLDDKRACAGVALGNVVRRWAGALVHGNTRGR